MMEIQEQECYGLPYTMHIRDIYSIEELTDERHVNRRMRDDGWVLLQIIQYGGGDQYAGVTVPMQHPGYVMGVPRPKTCDGWSTHDEEQQIWYHERKEWVCMECSRVRAEQDNEHLDKHEQLPRGQGF